MANMKKRNSSLSANHTMPGTQVNGTTAIGGSQPPRNMIEPIAHMVAMATYSPSMNIMYGAEPYSTMKPATSSDSASTRSNGGRLVSASADTKNTPNIGNSGSQYQLNRPNFPFCAATIADRFNEPAHSSTVIMTN